MANDNQSYANKNRPQRLSDVIGQTAVVEAWRGKFKEGRLPRTSMFCGAHGSGKTTLARIVAKAVNCENPNNGDPCCKCQSCLAIDAGQSPDVIEMDAASHNKVEDAEAIVNQANLLPMGNKKVLILDEMHMLTTGAQNKLLKMVEEPPAHVMIIFCTTEENKVLPTILSRCNRFVFKAVTDRDIYDNLVKVCEKEKLSYEPDALKLIVKSAQGHVRDSLSVLEQLSYERLTKDRVADVLGMAKDEELFLLLQAVAVTDYAQVDQMIGEILIRGNLYEFLRRIVEILCYLCIFEDMKQDNETEEFRSNCKTLIMGGITKERAMEWIRIITDTLRNNRGLGLDLAIRFCFLEMLKQERDLDKLERLENEVALLRQSVSSGKIAYEPTEAVVEPERVEQNTVKDDVSYHVSEMTPPEIPDRDYVPWDEKAQTIDHGNDKSLNCEQSMSSDEDEFFAGLDLGDYEEEEDAIIPDNRDEKWETTDNGPVSSKPEEDDEPPFSIPGGTIKRESPAFAEEKPLEIPGGKVLPTSADRALSFSAIEESCNRPHEDHPYKECKDFLHSAASTQAGSLLLYQSFMEELDGIKF